MAASLIMETIPDGYEDEDLIELAAVGSSHRAVRCGHAPYRQPGVNPINKRPEGSNNLLFLSCS